MVVGGHHLGRVDDLEEFREDRGTGPEDEVVPVDQDVRGGLPGGADDQRPDPLGPDPVLAGRVPALRRHADLDRAVRGARDGRGDRGLHVRDELFGERGAVGDVPQPFDVGVVRVDEDDRGSALAGDLAHDPVPDGVGDVVRRLGRLRHDHEDDPSQQLRAGQAPRIRAHEGARAVARRGGQGVEELDGGGTDPADLDGGRQVEVVVGRRMRDEDGPGRWTEDLVQLAREVAGPERGERAGMHGGKGDRGVDALPA